MSKKIEPKLAAALADAIANVLKDNDSGDYEFLPVEMLSKDLFNWFTDNPDRFIELIKDGLDASNYRLRQ